MASRMASCDVTIVLVYFIPLISNSEPLLIVMNNDLY
jgi:hypothetical protein